MRRIQENLTLIQTRCDSLEEHRDQVEEDLKMSGLAHKKLEREMNWIKPVLLKLYRKRERCQYALIQKGVMSQADLQELLREVTLACEQEDYCVSSPQQENPEEEEGDTWMEDGNQGGKWEPDTWLISGHCDKAQAIKMLQNRADGTFLIRSSSRPGYYALSVTCKNVVHHCLIEYQKGSGYGFEGTEVVFRDLAQFVRHYACNSIGDHNDKLLTRLRCPATKVPANREYVEK